MNGDGLRKRQVLNDDSGNINAINESGANSTSVRETNEKQLEQRSPAHQQNGVAVDWVQLATVVLHIAALLLVAYGLYLRAGFHNGDECEMTYSRRNYVPILTEDNQDDGAASTTSYNLFKFVDARDPRQQGILNTDRHPISDTSHCTTNNTFIVLYIPGHWGDYAQCRSIGAHGTQFTRSGHDRHYTATARQALFDGSWNGAAKLEEHFVYDVYCVDFAEQGAALHGNFIQRQSQYVAQVVKKLTHECSVPTITLVGHSIGGLVAKAVPVYHPSVDDKIQNIVTLATPHAGLPYTFDESMHRVYHDLKDLKSSVLITSISGGLKDELIPASLCEATTGISQMAGAAYGMDHKAIVWCHQVLEKVRVILFVLSNDETENWKAGIKKIGIVNGSYTKSVAQQELRYKEQYGFVAYIALESAMLYNAELLLAMYSLLCTFYLAVPNVRTWIPAVTVTGIAMMTSNHGLSMLSTLVVALLSNSIVCGLRAALPLLPRVIRSRPVPMFLSARLAVTGISLIFAVISVIAALIGSILQSKSPFWQVRSTVVIAVVVWIMLEALRVNPCSNSRNATFASLILVNVPFLTFGKVVLFCWNLLGEYGDLQVDFVLKIGLPIVVRFALGKNARDNSIESQCINSKAHRTYIGAHALNMLFFIAGTMQVGGGYLIGYYIAWVAVIESLRTLSSEPVYR